VPGDLNDDGSADVLDVQCAILSALSELSEPAAPLPTCLVGDLNVADPNCDGVVDVIDVLLFIEAALDIPLSANLDGNGNGCVDQCDEEPFDPVCTAEVVGSSINGQVTPPTWNPHLPKLVGDGNHWYVMHTEFTPDVDARKATIFSRPFAGGSWSPVATVDKPHQPPGMVVDIQGRLHMVFGCQKSASGDSTCFTGGAGTFGNLVRFYHLVFNSKDSNNAIVWNSYQNFNEWPFETNGYFGLSTTSNGVTIWSLADLNFDRQVQWWLSGSSFGTLSPLTGINGDLLYPVQITHPTNGTEGLVFFFGEFNPAGGSNASYNGTVGFEGGLSVNGLSLFLYDTPAVSLAPGAVGGYPSDGLYLPDGRLVLLQFMADSPTQCTELLRFDNGLNASPTVLPVGCFGTYNKLQLSSTGRLYLLASSGGLSFHLGQSDDLGETWTFHSVPVQGVEGTNDVQFFDVTPVTPHTSPLVFDPDFFVFLFSGYDGNGLAKHTYFGTIPLQ